jgi:hypothetical protein
MNANNFFSAANYGFRSLRSCALQLLEVMEKWTDWLDEGRNFDCLYYEFKKAFDMIPHSRLILMVLVVHFYHGSKHSLQTELSVLLLIIVNLTIVV